MSIASRMVTVQGNVYRLADPKVHSPGPPSFDNGYEAAGGGAVDGLSVDFGILHVGDAVGQALILTNNAPDNGFSERLNAGFDGTTGGATAGGSLSGLAPGATDQTSLVVGIDTSTAGAKSGTATILLESDGASSSGLGTTALPSETVHVGAQVNHFAKPAFLKLAGDGTLTQLDPISYYLDLGRVDAGEPNLLIALGLSNAAATPGDDLAGTYTLAAAEFLLSGFDGFDDLDAGDLLAGLVVELDSSHPGRFAGQITLHPFSENADGFSGELEEVSIALTGLVVPEPVTPLILLCGLTVILRRRRRPVARKAT